MTSAALVDIALPQLEYLLSLLASRQLAIPLDAAALQAKGLGECWGALRSIQTLDQQGMIAVLEAIVAERVRRPAFQLELVWTGPESRTSFARDTAVVVRQLFEAARRSVLVAGYSFSAGGEILLPLFRAIRDRSVDSMFIPMDDITGASPGESALAGRQRFESTTWTFGRPYPAVYYDPRTVAEGSSINLHAKCVVVDDRWTMVGSANFTHNAHARNIEVGVLIDDVDFALALTHQWRGLIETGLVARLT